MTTTHDAQVARNALYEVLQARVRGKVCSICDGYPFVAAPRATLVDGVWNQGDYFLRCNCYPKPPVLASAFKRETRGRI